MLGRPNLSKTSRGLGKLFLKQGAAAMNRCLRNLQHQCVVLLIIHICGLDTLFLESLHLELVVIWPLICEQVCSRAVVDKNVVKHSNDFPLKPS